LYSRWAHPLDLYELCLYVAHNCGEYFNRKFRSKAAAEKDFQFEALIRLHAGAVRVAGEIYALLLSGFASGAHARWRTLHEIAVTALFIVQEDKQTAERYVHHRFRSRRTRQITTARLMFHDGTVCKRIGENLMSSRQNAETGGPGS
jgi:hypothetical protein